MTLANGNTEAAPELRFAFGANWTSFAANVDDTRIEAAERSIQALLQVQDLRGARFLDAGCGSGLFSLAASRLGAGEIVSIDFDPLSVEAARAIKERFAANDRNWRIEEDDLTALDLRQRLGEFDVVYCWGVIHHTGAMWQAAANIAACVGPGGTLCLSIYNDQGFRSRCWRGIKRLYNRLPAAVRPIVAMIAVLPMELRSLLGQLVRGQPGDYLRAWRSEGRRRGMSKWHDIVDWVGGYPFEVATPEEVVSFYRNLGFNLISLRTVGGGSGCNEYVLQRPATSPLAS